MSDVMSVCGVLVWGHVFEIGSSLQYILLWWYRRSYLDKMVRINVYEPALFLWKGCVFWVNLLGKTSVPPWMPDVFLTHLILFNIITFQIEIESLTRYVSPVNPAVFPHLTVVLLGIGIFFTAWFFVYEVTSTKFTRDIFKELLVALVAAIFSGFGVLFLLLWVGIYVWRVSTKAIEHLTVDCIVSYKL